MGLFSGRRPDAVTSDVLQVATLMRAELQARGLPASIEGGDDADSATLVLADNFRLPLHNLVGRCRTEPRRRWRAIVREHVDAMIETRDQRGPEDLTGDELRRQIRTRLIDDQDVLMPDGTVLDFAYARPFAPGLVEALAVDLPRTVAVLPGASLRGMALPVDELYEYGRINTDQEPFDEHHELSEGLHVLSGRSLFVASRAGNVASLVPDVVGPAPHGVAFSVPNRNVLAYTVLTGDERTYERVPALASFTVGFTTDPDAFHPGGLLSQHVYYWAPDGRVERIAHLDDDGRLRIDATGALGEVLPATDEG